MCETGKERGTHVLRLELVLDDERPHKHAEEQGEDGRAADAHPRDEGDALVVEEEAEEGRHDDAADGRQERGEGARAHAVVKRQVRRGEAPVAASDVQRSAKYAQHRDIEGEKQGDDVQPRGLCAGEESQRSSS